MSLEKKVAETSRRRLFDMSNQRKDFRDYWRGDKLFVLATRGG